MGTTQQDEEGRFPGPTHPRRSPRAPPWLVVVPWGKNDKAYIHALAENGRCSSEYIFYVSQTQSIFSRMMKIYGIVCCSLWLA